MDTYLSLKLKILSFICMVFVVFRHALIIIDDKILYPFLQSFTTSGFTFIAVPLFFIISGYLYFLSYKNTIEDYFSKTKKRIKTLLIPYLIVSSIYLLLIIIPFTQKYQSSSLYLKDKPFLEKFLETFIFNPPGQLWFLKDLFVLILVTPIIYWLIKYLKFYFILILVLLWFPIIPFKFYIFQNEALLFFSLGAYLTTIQDFLLQKRKEYFYYLTTLIWLSILTIISLPYIISDSILYDVLLKVSIIWGIISVWGLYDICMKDRKTPNEFLLNISQYSFFIYLTHAPIILNSFKKTSIIFIKKSDSLLPFLYFFNVFITIILCIIIAKILQKYTPKLYNFVTGGR